MIRNHDRSGWFGASDTATIMGSWDTETFRRWWAVKLGIRKDHFANAAMQAGTAVTVMSDADWICGTPYMLRAVAGMRAARDGIRN